MIANRRRPTGLSWQFRLRAVSSGRLTGTTTASVARARSGLLPTQQHQMAGGETEMSRGIGAPLFNLVLILVLIREFTLLLFF
jgi:hypothetical protein